MNSVSHRAGRTIEDLRRLMRERPAPVVLGVLLAGALAGPAMDAVAQQLEFHWKITKPGFVLIGFGVVIFLFIAALYARSSSPQDISPPLMPEDIVVRNAFSSEELHRIRDGLHQSLYGGSAPDGGEIDQMYRKNPNIGVGLFDRTLDDFVAFAAAWPLRPDAALRIITGEMDENALTADDVLPASENASAEYLLVPAFGAAPSRRAALGRDLFYELRSMIRRNYFRTPDRSVTVIATGFSQDGKRWCERLGMRPACFVPLKAAAPAECAVYTLALTSDDLA